MIYGLWIAILLNTKDVYKFAGVDINVYDLCLWPGK